MNLLTLLHFSFIINVANAYTSTLPAQIKKVARESFAAASVSVSAAAATVSLAFLLSAEPAHASDSAAQVSLNSIPPNSVSIQVKELPVIGNLVSGTYTKVAPDDVNSPSIVIKAPKDKIKAIKNAASTGHIEVDVNGVIGTHVDVDIAAEQNGVATIRVASPLIPKLPFKNLASGVSTGDCRGAVSLWWQLADARSSATTWAEGAPPGALGGPQRIALGGNYDGPSG